MTALTSHLKLLEAESIHFREAAAQFRAPVLLYSIGKVQPSCSISRARPSGRPSRRSRCSMSTPRGNSAR